MLDFATIKFFCFSMQSSIKFGPEINQCKKVSSHSVSGMNRFYTSIMES